MHIYKKKLPHPSWGELVSGFEYFISIKNRNKNFSFLKVKYSITMN